MSADVGKAKSLTWKPAPEHHDFDAALSYLTLLFDPADAKKLVGKLKAAKDVTRDAKDILRASDLALLPKTNKHVAIDLAKVKRGEPLSPVLLVRGRGPDPRLIIADGYHRVCAAWYLDEDDAIPSRLVSQ